MELPMGLHGHKLYEEAASHSEQNGPEYLCVGQIYLKYTNPHNASRQNLIGRDESYINSSRNQTTRS
jgi:hypothetical protein